MKARSTGRKNNEGMSTLEILVAFAVSILSVAAVILLTFGNQSIAVSSQTHHEAISKAQNILEEARAKSRDNYSEIKNCEDETSLPCSGSVDNFYIRKLEMDQSSMTQCAGNLKSEVTFTINNQSESVEFMTRLTDIVTAIALGADCPSLPPSGNWSAPTVKNSRDTTPSTLKATGVDVKNKIVYVSTDPSAASDPDFFIFDASNNSLTSLANINTGPGLEDVDAAGSYVYAANDSKNGQLQVIDVSNPNSPILKNTFNVAPGGTDTNTVGVKVFYYNKTIYLGLKKNTGPEFYAISVVNPLSPFVIGSYEVNASVNSINVRGDYAYIATPNSEELTIIDANTSSPKFMQRVGGFDAPAGSGNGKSISIVGNTLYLGRTVGNTEFYILDISDPKNPTVIGSYDINSSINDLVVSGSYTYLTTGQTNSELQILNITDPENPTLIGKYNYGNKSTGIDYEDNLIYISSENGDALIIIQPET